MKGETTLDERIVERLRILEELRNHYAGRYTGLDGSDWPKVLVSQLVADATYLATYHGLDFETIVEETVPDIRKAFPDIP